MTPRSLGTQEEGAAGALLERYLSLRDSGREQEAEELAGGASAELRGQIRLLAELDALSGLLAGDAEEVPDDLQRLGRFEELELLGKGGLSKVFLALDPRLGRRVALKVLAPGGISSRGAADWMLSEGRSLAQLTHASVVRVFEVDEVDGFAYIAMEHIDGPSLYEVLEALRGERDGAPPADERSARAATGLGSVAARLRLASQLTHALSYCHERGIIHRDIKPANVLIDRDGTPKLIDFGLAHFAHEGDSLGLTQELVGTSAYLAPEQVDAERTGASALSDQFSLGILLYELLTLENPFARDTRAATMTAVSAADVSPIARQDRAVPTDVERICLHCLERDPENRYPSMAELAADLDAFLEYRAISVRAPSAVKALRLWVRRNRRQVLTGTLVAVAVMVIGTTVWLRAALGSRRVLAREIEGADGALALLEDPEELFLALEEITRLDTLAHEADMSIWAGTILPLSVPRIEQLKIRAAERVREVANSGFEAAREDIPRRRERTDLARKKYGNLLGAEALATGSSLNDDLRNLGKVTLPEGGKVFLYFADSYGLPLLGEIERIRMGEVHEGQHRWMGEVDGQVLEIEFLIEPWLPRQVLSPSPISAEILDRMIVWDEETSIVVGGPDTSMTTECAPFAITADLISWADIANALPGRLDSFQTLLKTLPNGEILLEMDKPAPIKWSEAREYATAIGGRLPTALELYLAHRDLGLILGPDGSWEWTSWTVTRDPGSADRRTEARAQFRPLATETIQTAYSSVRGMARLLWPLESNRVLQLHFGLRSVRDGQIATNSFFRVVHSLQPSIRIPKHRR